MEESTGDSPVDFTGNKKFKSQDEEDRISSLPDPVIQHILSLLPSTMEAIRTGILSKRWRNQWKFVPVLIFDPSGVSGEQHLKFIEKTLNLHQSPKLRQFDLFYVPHSDQDPDFFSKIDFAIEKSVEDLFLNCESDRDLYFLPSNIFDCASLVRFGFVNCYFMPDRKVNWPSLKGLKIDCRRLCQSDKVNQAIENIFSGSPLLDCLDIHGAPWDHADLEFPINIVSKSLSCLCILNLKVPAANISCPNLVQFHLVSFTTVPNRLVDRVLSGCPFLGVLTLSYCIGIGELVIASKSLKELYLRCVHSTKIELSCPNLERMLFVCCDNKVFKTVNLPSSMYVMLDYFILLPLVNFITERQLLEEFRHVEKLSIFCSFFRMISNLDAEVRLSLPLLKCKCLTLNIGGNFLLALPGIAYALRSPLLEKLVLNFVKLRKDTSKKDLRHSIISKFCYWSTDLACLVSHLKTVEINDLYETDHKCKLVLEFIEFLLENARVLEKMIVKLEKPRTSFLNHVTQKLLSFPRYSQCVNVELLSS